MSALKSLISVKLFFVVISARSLYNIGAACLTVDKTFQVLYCLKASSTSSSSPSNKSEHLNLSLQVVAAFFSTSILLLSRSPKIWQRVSTKPWKISKSECLRTYASLSKLKKSAFLFSGILGVLACAARGIAAFHGTEVLLEDRLSSSRAVGEGLSISSGVVIATVSMMFNFSIMMECILSDLKKSSIKPSRYWILPLLCCILAASGKRFFIQSFLKRRNSQPLTQWILQSVFFVSEFTMSIFTQGRSLTIPMLKNSYQTIKSSRVFSAIALGDGLTSWIGYYWIVFYALMHDTASAGSKSGTTNDSQHPTNTQQKYCPSEKYALNVRIPLLMVALLVALPVTVTYVNYILTYAKAGFDSLFSCQSNRDPEASPLLNSGINTSSMEQIEMRNSP